MDHAFAVLIGVFIVKAIWQLIESSFSPNVSSAQNQKQVETLGKPSGRTLRSPFDEERADKLRKLRAHEQSARAIGSIHEADAFAAKIQELRRNA